MNYSDLNNKKVDFFLWSSRGASRCHWVNWRAICLPIEEGGLGLRSLAQIQYSLHAKLMWLAMQGDSLWAKYCKSKYFSDDILTTKSNTTSIWRSIQIHEPLLRASSRWILGRGDTPFWGVNWIGEILNAPSFCDSKMSCANGLQSIEQLLTYIRPELHDRIRQVVLHPEVDDSLIFTGSENGLFSTKEYWEMIREKGTQRIWPLRIWHNFIPYKVCAFMWRLIRHALPVDLRVRAKGVLIVSRCSCCHNPSEESLQHLFLKSDCACQVWQHFENVFDIPHVYDSILRLVVLWSPKNDNNTQYAAIRTSVCYITLNEIWNARCRAVFEGEAMNPNSIIRKIKNQILMVASNFKPNKPSTSLQIQVIETIGLIPSNPTMRAGLWCKWELPTAGFKLNVDGSARNGVCTGGGIIRNRAGEFVAAFSAKYGDGTNNRGELLALIDGLNLCHSLHITSLQIETDSKWVVDVIRDGKRCYWELEYSARTCKRLLTNSFRCDHIYRQKNIVADRLADWAHQHHHYMEYFREGDLPRSAWVAFRCDQLGLANYRP